MYVRTARTRSCSTHDTQRGDGTGHARALRLLATHVLYLRMAEYSTCHVGFIALPAGVLIPPSLSSLLESPRLSSKPVR